MRYWVGVWVGLAIASAIAGVYGFYEFESGIYWWPVIVSWGFALGLLLFILMFRAVIAPERKSDGLVAASVMAASVLLMLWGVQVWYITEYWTWNLVRGFVIIVPLLTGVFSLWMFANLLRKLHRAEGASSEGIVAQTS